MNRRKFFKSLLGIGFGLVAAKFEINKGTPPEKAKVASFEYHGYLVPEEYQDALTEHDEEEEFLLRSGYFGAGSSGLSAPITDWDWSAKENLENYMELHED